MPTRPARTAPGTIPSPSPRGSVPLRVALLCSRRAPGLAELRRDPRFGRTFEIVTLLATGDPPPEAIELEHAGVPLLRHDIRSFCAERGGDPADLRIRRAFDRRTVRLLAPHEPEVVLLSGYLWILTRPMLEAFEARIVNIHDADLLRVGADGRPLYRGLHATRDAILAGESETRLTAHLVTAEVDVGPVLVRSWPFAVHPLVEDARRWGADDILKAYAYAQREWMIRAAWSRVVARTLSAWADGRIRLLNGQALVGDSLGPEDLGAPGASPEPPHHGWLADLWADRRTDREVDRRAGLWTDGTQVEQRRRAGP